MSAPSLYMIFEYLATLIAERDPGQPFLVGQIQPAIVYKFPGFNLATYNLAGLKDFVMAGEKAGYFKLVNTGDIKTAYLAPGTAPKVQPQPQQTRSEELAANDPRRMRWMTLAMEGLLSGERADQLLDAIKDIEALTPEFDSFIAAQAKSVTYPVKGKIQRVREFLNILRDQGESQATSLWKVSRVVFQMPQLPATSGLGETGGAQTLIWNLMQGTTALQMVPIDNLNNTFMAILKFDQELMAHNRSWDWVDGLKMLEADVRAIPRPAPPQPKKGMFGGSNKPVPPPPYILDEAEINRIAELLLQASGIHAKTDNTPLWQAYVSAQGLEGAARFLAEHRDLIENDQLLNWLDDQISQALSVGQSDAVKNLASKSAVVIGARQFGLQELRQKSADLKQLYDSIMSGAQLLGLLLTFIEEPTPAGAAQFFQQRAELQDQDNIGPMFEDQVVKAAHKGDVDHYRQVTQRMDLWRHLAEFGLEEGLRQHQRLLAAPADNNTLQAEMGLLLLTDAQDIEARRDVIERFPAIASPQGLKTVNGTLEMLSFHGAPADEYNRYYDIKRLIERCLEVGIDRALAEVK